MEFLYKQHGFGCTVCGVHTLCTSVRVLYVYSPPCTLPPQKQKQERIVKTPDKSDKCDRNDSRNITNQGRLHMRLNAGGDIRIRQCSFLGRASGDWVRMAASHMFSFLREGDRATGER